MSVSIEAVIEHGGYDLTTLDDARWLLSTQSEYADLIEAAEETVERLESEAEDEDDE